MVYNCFTPCDRLRVVEPVTVSQPAEEAGGPPAAVLMKMMSRRQVPCGSPTTISAKQHLTDNADSPAARLSEKVATTDYVASTGSPLSVRQGDGTACGERCVAADNTQTAAVAKTLAVEPPLRTPLSRRKILQKKQARSQEKVDVLSRRSSRTNRPPAADADVVRLATSAAICRSEHEEWNRKRTAILPERLPANRKKTRFRRAFGAGREALLAPSPPLLLTVQAQNVSCKQQECAVRQQQRITQEHQFSLQQQQHPSAISPGQQHPQQKDTGCLGVVGPKQQRSLITFQQQRKYSLRDQRQHCGLHSEGHQTEQWRQEGNGKMPPSLMMKDHKTPQWRPKPQQQDTTQLPSQTRQAYQWRESKEVKDTSKTRQVSVPQLQVREQLSQDKPRQRKPPQPHRRLPPQRLRQWQPVVLPRPHEGEGSVKHKQCNQRGESSLSVSTTYNPPVATGGGRGRAAVGMAARMSGGASTKTEEAAVEETAATTVLTEASAQPLPAASGTTRSEPATAAKRHRRSPTQYCSKSLPAAPVRSFSAPSHSCPSKRLPASAATPVAQNRLKKQHGPSRKQQHLLLHPGRLHQQRQRQRLKHGILHVFRAKEHVAVVPTRPSPSSDMPFPLYMSTQQSSTSSSTTIVTRSRCLPVSGVLIQLSRSSRSAPLRDASTSPAKRKAYKMIAAGCNEAPAVIKHGDENTGLLKTLESARAASLGMCHSAKDDATGAARVNSLSRAARAAAVDAACGKDPAEIAKGGQTQRGQRHRCTLKQWRRKRKPEDSGRAGAKGFANAGIDTPREEREKEILGSAAPARSQVITEEDEPAGSAGAEMDMFTQPARTATTADGVATMEAGVIEGPAARTASFGRGVEVTAEAVGVITAQTPEATATTAAAKSGHKEESLATNAAPEDEKETPNGELDDSESGSMCSDQDLLFAVRQESNVSITSSSYFDVEGADYLIRGDTQSSVSSAWKAKELKKCSASSGSLRNYLVNASQESIKGMGDNAVHGWGSVNNCINCRNSSSLSNRGGPPAASSAFYAAATVMHTKTAAAESRRSSVIRKRPDPGNNTATIDAVTTSAVGAPEAAVTGGESIANQEDKSSTGQQQQIVDNSNGKPAEGRTEVTSRCCVGMDDAMKNPLAAHMEKCDYTASSATTTSALPECKRVDAVTVPAQTNFASGTVGEPKASKGALLAEKLPEGQGDAVFAEAIAELSRQDAARPILLRGGTDAMASSQESSDDVLAYPGGEPESRRHHSNAGFTEEEDGKAAASGSAIEAEKMERFVLNKADKAPVTRLLRRGICPHSSLRETNAVQQAVTNVAVTGAVSAPSATSLVPAALQGHTVAATIVVSPSIVSNADGIASSTRKTTVYTAAVSPPSSVASTNPAKAAPALSKRRDNGRCGAALVNDTVGVALKAGSAAPDTARANEACSEATHVEEARECEPAHVEQSHSKQLQQRQPSQLNVAVVNASVPRVEERKGQEQKNVQQLQASLLVTTPLRQQVSNESQSAASVGVTQQQLSALLFQQLNVLLQLQKDRARTSANCCQFSSRILVPAAETAPANNTGSNMLKTGCAPASRRESTHKYHGGAQQVQHRQHPEKQLQERVLQLQHMQRQLPHTPMEEDQHQKIWRHQSVTETPCLRESREMIQEPQRQPTPSQQMTHQQVRELRGFTWPHSSLPNFSVLSLRAPSVGTGGSWYCQSTYKASVKHSPFPDASEQRDERDGRSPLRVAGRQQLECVKCIHQLPLREKENDEERRQRGRDAPQVWNRLQMQGTEYGWKVEKEWQQQRGAQQQQKKFWREGVCSCGEYRGEASSLDWLELQVHHQVLQYHQKQREEAISRKHSQHPPDRWRLEAHTPLAEHMMRPWQAQQWQLSFNAETCVNNDICNMRQVTLKTGSTRWLRCSLRYVWRLIRRVQQPQQQQAGQREAAQPQPHLPECRRDFHILASKGASIALGNESSLLSRSSSRNTAIGVVCNDPVSAMLLGPDDAVVQHAVPDAMHTEAYSHRNAVLGAEKNVAVVVEQGHATRCAADTPVLHYNACSAKKCRAGAGTPALPCPQELPLARQQLLAAAVAVLPRLYGEASAAAPPLRNIRHSSAEQFLACKTWRSTRDKAEWSSMPQREMLAVRSSSDGSSVTANECSSGSTLMIANVFSISSRTTSDSFSKTLPTVCSSARCSNSSGKLRNPSKPPTQNCNCSGEERTVTAAEFKKGVNRSTSSTPSALEDFLLRALPLLADAAKTIVRVPREAHHVGALPAKHEDRSAAPFVDISRDPPQDTNSSNCQDQSDARCSASSTYSSNTNRNKETYNSTLIENSAASQFLKAQQNIPIQDKPPDPECPTLLTDPRIRPGQQWLQELLLHRDRRWVDIFQKQQVHINQTLPALRKTKSASQGTILEVCGWEKAVGKSTSHGEADKPPHSSTVIYTPAAGRCNSSPCAARNGGLSTHHVAPHYSRRPPGAAACATSLDAATASYASAGSDNHAGSAASVSTRNDTLSALLRPGGWRAVITSGDQELLPALLLSLEDWVKGTIKQLFELNASHRLVFSSNTCNNDDCYCNAESRRRVQSSRQISCRPPKKLMNGVVARGPSLAMKEKAVGMADVDIQAAVATFKLAESAGEEAAAVQDPGGKTEEIQAVQKTATEAGQIAHVSSTATGASFSTSAASTADSTVNAATDTSFLRRVTAARRTVHETDVERLAASPALWSNSEQSEQEAENKEKVVRSDGANRSYSAILVETAVTAEEGNTGSGVPPTAVHDDGTGASAKGRGSAAKRRAMGEESNEVVENKEGVMRVALADKQNGRSSGLQDVYSLFCLVPKLYRCNASAFSLLLHDSALLALFPLHPEEVAAFAGLMLQQPQPVAALLHRWLAPQYCSTCDCCTCCCSCCCCCGRDASAHSQQQQRAVDMCDGLKNTQASSEKHQQYQSATLWSRYLSQETQDAQRVLSSQQNTLVEQVWQRGGQQPQRILKPRSERPTRAHTDDLLVCKRSVLQGQQYHLRECDSSLFAGLSVHGARAETATGSSVPQPEIQPAALQAARAPTCTNATATASREGALLSELRATTVPGEMTANTDLCNNCVFHHGSTASLTQHLLVSKRGVSPYYGKPTAHQLGVGSRQQHATCCTRGQVPCTPKLKESILCSDNFGQEYPHLQKDPAEGRVVDYVAAMQEWQATGEDVCTSGMVSSCLLSPVQGTLRKCEQAGSSSMKQQVEDAQCSASHAEGGVAQNMCSASTSKPVLGIKSARQRPPVREVDPQVQLDVEQHYWDRWSRAPPQPPQQPEQHQAATFLCRKQEQQQAGQKQPVLQVEEGGAGVQVLLPGGHQTLLGYPQPNRQQHLLGQQQLLQHYLWKEQENDPEQQQGKLLRQLLSYLASGRIAHGAGETVQQHTRDFFTTRKPRNNIAGKTDDDVPSHHRSRASRGHASGSVERSSIYTMQSISASSWPPAAASAPSTAADAPATPTTSFLETFQCCSAGEEVGDDQRRSCARFSSPTGFVDPPETIASALLAAAAKEEGCAFPVAGSGAASEFSTGSTLSCSYNRLSAGGMANVLPSVIARSHIREDELKPELTLSQGSPLRTTNHAGGKAAAIQAGETTGEQGLTASRSTYNYSVSAKEISAAGVRTTDSAALPGDRIDCARGQSEATRFTTSGEPAAETSKAACPENVFLAAGIAAVKEGPAAAPSSQKMTADFGCSCRGRRTDETAQRDAGRACDVMVLDGSGRQPAFVQVPEQSDNKWTSGAGSHSHAVRRCGGAVSAIPNANAVLPRIETSAEISAAAHLCAAAAFKGAGVCKSSDQKMSTLLVSTSIEEARRNGQQCDHSLSPCSRETQGDAPPDSWKEKNEDRLPKKFARVYGSRSAWEAEQMSCLHTAGIGKLPEDDCFVLHQVEPSYKCASCFFPLLDTRSSFLPSAASSSSGSNQLLHPYTSCRPVVAQRDGESNVREMKPLCAASRSEGGICTAGYSPPLHWGTSRGHRSCTCCCSGTIPGVCRGSDNSGGRRSSRIRDVATGKGTATSRCSCDVARLTSLGDGEVRCSCVDDSHTQALPQSVGAECSTYAEGITREQVSELYAAFPPEKAADPFTQQLCDMFTGTVGAPAITVYVRRLQELSRLGAHEALMALLLLSRLMARHPYLPFCPWNAHRLLLAAFLVITKSVSDRFYNNKVWARFGGIKVTELNRLEKAFLILIDHRCFVSLEQFAAGYALLKRTRCMFPARLAEQELQSAASSVLLQRYDKQQQMHAGEARPKEIVTQHLSGDRKHGHERLGGLQQSQETQLPRLHTQHVHPEQFDQESQQHIRQMQGEQSYCTSGVALNQHRSRSREGLDDRAGTSLQNDFAAASGRVCIDGSSSSDRLHEFQGLLAAYACGAAIHSERAAGRALEEYAGKQVVSRRGAVEVIPSSGNNNKAELDGGSPARSAVERNQQSGSQSGSADGDGAEEPSQKVMGGERVERKKRVSTIGAESNNTYPRHCGASVVTVSTTQCSESAPRRGNPFPVITSVNPRGICGSHSGTPYSRRGSAMSTNRRTDVAGKSSSCVEQNCRGNGATRVLPCYSSARSEDYGCCRWNKCTVAWSGLADGDEPEAAEMRAATPKAYRQLLLLRRMPFSDLLQQYRRLARQRSNSRRQVAHENLHCSKERSAGEQLPRGGSAAVVAAEKEGAGNMSTTQSGKHLRSGTDAGIDNIRSLPLAYSPKISRKAGSQSGILQPAERDMRGYREEVSRVQHDDGASLSSTDCSASEGSVSSMGSDTKDEMMVDALADEQTAAVQKKQRAGGGSGFALLAIGSPHGGSCLDLIENPFANLIFCMYPPLQRALTHLNGIKQGTERRRG